MTMTRRIAEVRDSSIVYHEAGDRSKPAILMLDGLSAPEQRYRELVRLLEDDFHVVVVHLPEVGRLMARSGGESFKFSGIIAEIVDGFAEAAGLERFALYMVNHDVPHGFNIAARQGRRVTAFINGNRNSGTGDPRNARSLAGPPRPSDDPTAGAGFWIRPGAAETQLDLFLDLGSNLESYAAYQAYFSALHPNMSSVETDLLSPALVDGADEFTSSEALPLFEISPLSAGGRPETAALLLKAFLAKQDSWWERHR